MGMSRIVLPALAAAAPAEAWAQPKALRPPADLDAYVARVMGQFEVPGIGLAIVRDGQIVVAKG